MKHKHLFMIFALVFGLYTHFSYPALLPLNEDEIAQGYNTYSVLRTGKDEHGLLPIRYLSFGENKLPVTGMLSAPLIVLFGLTNWTIRLPIMVIGIILPFALYLLVRAWGGNERWGLLVLFFSTTSQWLIQMTRHQHEAPVVALVVVTYLILHARYEVRTNKWTLGYMACCILVGLYTYHSAKILMPGLALFTVVSLWKQGKRFVVPLVTCTIAILLFVCTELAIPTNRLATTSYFTSPGFIHEINEGRSSGGSRLFYNKAVFGVVQFLARSSHYLSSAFFMGDADDNLRFAHPQVPLATRAAYLLFLIGFLLLWGKKRKWWYLCAYLMVLAITPAAASRSAVSSTRSFTFFIPFVLCVGYAVDVIFQTISLRFRHIVLCCILTIHLISSYNVWQSYIQIYASDFAALRAWSAGMEDVARYAWREHKHYDKVFISSRYGQAYVYLLMYGGPYDPIHYQSAPKEYLRNEYGFFTQSHVENIDFHLPQKLLKNELAIIHVDELAQTPFVSLVPHTAIRYHGNVTFLVYVGSGP